MAQIPEQITYQGRLSNNQNQPITGCLDMTFRLYDGPGGGATLLWTEAHLAAGTGCNAAAGWRSSGASTALPSGHIPMP